MTDQNRLREIRRWASIGPSGLMQQHPLGEFVLLADVKEVLAAVTEVAGGAAQRDWLDACDMSVTTVASKLQALSDYHAHAAAEWDATDYKKESDEHQKFSDMLRRAVSSFLGGYDAAQQPEVAGGAAAQSTKYEQLFHCVMGWLRNTKMPHGLCEPRERKACTHCNAVEELDKMLAEYKGPRIIAQAAQRADRLREALEQAAIDLDYIANVCENASRNKGINRMAKVIRDYAKRARLAAVPEVAGGEALTSQDIAYFDERAVRQGRLEEARYIAGAEWDCLVVKTDIEIVRTFFAKRIEELAAAQRADAPVPSTAVERPAQETGKGGT